MGTELQNSTIMKLNIKNKVDRENTKMELKNTQIVTRKLVIKPTFSYRKEWKKKSIRFHNKRFRGQNLKILGILSESEEDAVVQKEIKQTKETLDLAPADRTDIIQECKYRIEVLSQFAPKMMAEEEIEAIIAGVLSDLGIENPTKNEKGKIMKTLMPMVKGKADGKLVNQILEKKLA